MRKFGIGLLSGLVVVVFIGAMWQPLQRTRLFDSDNTNFTELRWNEDDATDRTLNFEVNAGDRTLSFYENFTIGNGYNLTITAEDAISSITLDEQTLEVEGEGTATRLFKLINAEDAARTVTFNEDFTIGNGNSGTITFTAAAKTLSVEDDATVDQDMSGDANWATTGTLGSGAFTSSSTGLFQGASVTVGTTAQAGTLVMFDGTDHSVTFDIPAIAGSYTLTMPTTDGDADQQLTTDGAGALSWAAAGAGAVDTSGAPVDDDWARFTDLDTIEGLSDAEAIAILEPTIEGAIDTLANLVSVQGQTLTLAGSLITQNNNVTINAVDAARTLTLTESLTVGGGFDGTLTYSATTKTLTVEDDTVVNQDLSSDATPTFAGVTLDSGAGGELQLFDADQSHYTSITQAAIAGNIAWILPNAAGAANTVFSNTDGATGTMAWKVIGIADNNVMEVDSATAADNDFARFTAAGLEGRSYAETLADLSGQASGAFAWNAQNLTGIGTIGSGAITSTSTGLFQGASVTVGTTAQAGTLIMYDGSDHAITIDVPAIAGSWALTLPTVDGDASQYLQTDGAGNTTWATPAGTGTMTTVEHGDAGVGGADIVTLDFLAADFIIAEDPNTEINISLDYANGTKASTTAPGFLTELTTTAELNAGVDTTRGVTADAVAGSTFGRKTIVWKLTASDGVITSGDALDSIKTTADLAGWLIVDVDARVVTVDDGADDIVIDIYNLTQTADVLSTAMTIDGGDASEGGTTPFVIDAAQDDITAGDILRIDVTTYVGDNAAGLEVHITFEKVT